MLVCAVLLRGVLVYVFCVRILWYIRGVMHSLHSCSKTIIATRTIPTLIRLVMPTHPLNLYTRYFWYRFGLKYNTYFSINDHFQQQIHHTRNSSI